MRPDTPTARAERESIAVAYLAFLLVSPLTPPAVRAALVWRRVVERTSPRRARLDLMGVTLVGRRGKGAGR